MAQDLGVPISDLIGEGAKKLLDQRTKWASLVGEFTFDDIVKELEKPGRDPRDPFKIFQFRDDIFEVKDLKEGMICPGIVTNVTNFGAFVDIGVHQDGLVHISELSHKFVDDPRKVVNSGDSVTVKVMKVDMDKNQISLSMKMDGAPAVAEKRERPARKEGAAKPKAAKPVAPAGPKRPPPLPDSQRPPEERPARAASQRSGPPPRPDSARQAPDPNRPRPQPGPARGGGGNDRGGGSRPAPGGGQPFNNPFAALLTNNQKK